MVEFTLTQERESYLFWSGALQTGCATFASFDFCLHSNQHHRQGRYLCLSYPFRRRMAVLSAYSKLLVITFLIVNYSQVLQGFDCSSILQSGKYCVMDRTARYRSSWCSIDRFCRCGLGTVLQISHRNLSHAERRYPSKNEATKFRRTHDSRLKTYSCSFNKETVKKSLFSRTTRSSKKRDSSRLQSQFEQSAKSSHFVFNDTKPVQRARVLVRN